MSDASSDLTGLLKSWAQDEPDALDRLVPLVIDDLRRLALHHVRSVGSTPTLQPTAIVNEAFLRLHRKKALAFESRAHFFAFSSKLIRDLLVDHLRSRQAARRGSGKSALPLTAVGEPAGSVGMDPDSILALHQLLEVLERRDPRRARVVEMRYFGGLTMPEIAEVSDRSLATVERDWDVARRWLASEWRAS